MTEARRKEDAERAAADERAAGRRAAEAAKAAAGEATPDVNPERSQAVLEEVLDPSAPRTTARSRGRRRSAGSGLR